MPTVIDSLLVKLGLDSSEFRTGKGKVDQGLRETGAEADKASGKLKKTGDSFEGAAKSAVKFLAILGGGVAIKQFVMQTIESSAALDRFSKNVDVSVDRISALSNAAELAGGSAQGLQGSLDMLSRSQTEMQLTGQSGLIPYLSALGVAMADVNGRARPVDDMLLDLADRFSRLDRPTANNMGRMMGLDQGTMQLLLKGRSEVELMLKRQQEFNAVTKQQAEEASRLRVAMVSSRQSFEAFGRELLSTATPALEWLFGVLSKIGDWMRENKEFVNAFLTLVAVGLGAIAAATIPINLTATAVLGLAAAIASLYDDYQTWKKGGDSLIDWSKWEKGINLAKEGIGKFQAYASDAFYRIFAAADAAMSAVNGDWEHARWAWNEAATGRPDLTSPSPSAPTTGAPAASGGPMTPQKFFESRGWSPAQAAGIIANLQRESGLDPTAVGDSGKAYGVAQWHPDRQRAFAAWAGKDIRNASLQEQLAFVHYELTEGNERGAGAALRGAVTAQRAGEVVSRMYERPADVEGEAGRRGALARSLYLGLPGASQIAAGTGAGMASPGAYRGETKIETKIDKIEVHTAATDAPGIARDMGKEVDYLFTSQFNYGLN